MKMVTIVGNQKHGVPESLGIAGISLTDMSLQGRFWRAGQQNDQSLHNG